MSENDPILDDIALALTALAGRLDAIEKGMAHEREMQRQTLGLLVQFLERQTEGMKRVEGKLAEMAAVKRQAVVKGQVLIAKPKTAPVQPLPAPSPPPSPLPPPAADVEPEIEQQISEAIGNISAMLKKKESRRRKGG